MYTAFGDGCVLPVPWTWKHTALFWPEFSEIIVWEDVLRHFFGLARVVINAPVSTAESSYQNLWRILLHSRLGGMAHSIAGDFKVLFPSNMEYSISVRDLNRSIEFYSLHRQTADVPFCAVIRLGEDGCLSTSLVYRVVTPSSDPTGTEVRNIQAFYRCITYPPK
jgi:hypothetical protein